MPNVGIFGGKGEIVKPLIFTNVFFSYEDGGSILSDFSFAVEAGRVEAVVGRSGSGKSTVLRLASGLLSVDSGRILIGENSPDSPRTKVGLVSQNYALFPWMTVFKNIVSSRRGIQLSSPDAIEWARHLVVLFGLEDVVDLFPKSLSGGMKQRVAIARALFMRPDILCLDEPFSALDVALREDAQNVLRAAIREYPSTVVFVTHDIREAVELSDQVSLFEKSLDDAHPGSISVCKFATANKAQTIDDIVDRIRGDSPGLDPARNRGN